MAGGSGGGFTLTGSSGPKVTSIAITPANPAIAVSGTKALTATATYSDNSTKDVTSTATWTSGTTTVATVDTHGTATGVTAGASTITATQDGVSGSTNLTVLAAGWSTPATDLSAVGQDASGPQVALSADGTKATAVWYHFNGTNYIIQAASATISGHTATWGSTTDLSATLQDASLPQVALSADGTKATAVWHRSNGTNLIVQAASATVSGNTATWSSTSDLSAVGQPSIDPKVALSADGSKATAVWQRWNGSANIIQAASAAISGTTVTWSSSTDVSSVGPIGGGPQVALSADGSKATAVWLRWNGTNYIVQAASATISGNTATWSSSTDLSAVGQNANEPQVALSADGTKATAVWWRMNGTNKVQAASATISGTTATWSSASDLSAVGQNDRHPQVALSADGSKATAVWLHYGTDTIVQAASAAISGTTATWSSTSDLSAVGHSSYTPQVALSADGTKATAVWLRLNGTNYIVQTSSYFGP